MGFLQDAEEKLASLSGKIGLARNIEVLKYHRFQRTYNFEVLMPDLFPYPGELVAPLIQSVEYEDYNILEPSQMKAGPYIEFYPNSFAKPSLTLTFMETDEGLVKLYLGRWRNRIVDSKGLWGQKYGTLGYAQDIIVTYLNNFQIPLREVKFRKAFPLVSYKAKLDYMDNDILKIQVPFSCDRVEEGLIGTI